MRYVRSFALAVALAFLILPAAPLGGIVPIPTVGGDAAAYIDLECDFYTYAANGGSCETPPPPPPGGGNGGWRFFNDPCMGCEGHHLRHMPNVLLVHRRILGPYELS